MITLLSLIMQKQKLWIIIYTTIAIFEGDTRYANAQMPHTGVDHQQNPAFSMKKPYCAIGFTSGVFAKGTRIATYSCTKTRSTPPYTGSFITWIHPWPSP
jgi:hypothetical protein